MIETRLNSFGSIGVIRRLKTLFDGQQVVGQFFQDDVLGRDADAGQIARLDGVTATRQVVQRSLPRRPCWEVARFPLQPPPERAQGARNRASI